MSTRSALALAASSLLFLTACGGADNLSPFIAAANLSEDDAAAPDPGDVIDGVPEVLANNLSAITFNAAENSWDVTLTSLDAGTEAGTYNATPALDTNGFLAYTIQETSLQRHFTLLISESADAAIRAGTVSDGGQFNRFFAGTFYARTGDYQPGTGLATYTGNYAGLTNIEGDDPGILLTPPPGTDPLDLPEQAGRVSGTVLMNVDFVDNAINGAIRERVIIRSGGPDFALEDIVLVISDIDDEGQFFGGAELEDQTGVGDYGGIIGGTNGQFIGGSTKLQDYIETIDNEEEYGVFVLESCVTSGDPACP
ncbi:MAG: hypothetical protein AAFQ54_02865 [Pseudomonadota bacterium]